MPNQNAAVLHKYPALRKYLALLFSVFLIAGLAESSNYKHHPLINSYPGARLNVVKTVDYDAFHFPTSAVDVTSVPLKYEQLEAKGRVLTYIYEIKKDSTLKVYENYTNALKALDFKVIFTCELDACGSTSAASALSELLIMNNITSSPEKPYYLVAEKITANGKIYGAWFIGGLQEKVVVQQIIVEEKPPENDLIKVSHSVLMQQIDTDGKALIYGIYFDANEAKIKSESKPALDAIAHLLAKRRDLSLYVVGHTDDTGTDQNNIELSRLRADSVVNELINTYKIPASRLQARGAGSYAPVSNNTTDEGKQKNRRVELVKRVNG